MNLVKEVSGAARAIQSKCPKCGLENKCAIEAGKSFSACWCVGMPVRGEVSGEQCLCRRCLRIGS